MFMKPLPGDPPRIRAAQLRGARAILGLSLVELAGAAGVSVSAVSHAERGEDRRDSVPTLASALRALRVALEARGICFLESDAGAFGVSLDRGAVQPPVEGL